CKKFASKMARGSLEIRSEPAGAQAFVDGRFIGATPVSAEGLLVGRHFVTFKREGYQKAVVRAQVSAKRQETVSADLRRSEKYLLLQQSIDRARTEFGVGTASSSMQDLRAFLFIDQVVFVRMSGQLPHLEVEGALYDLRSKLKLSQAKQTLESET